MKPWRELGRTQVPGGGLMTLSRRGHDFVITVDTIELMTSRETGSEESLSEIGCVPIAKRKGATVLIGGLGMGFTLRAALHKLQDDAHVVVAELVPKVVEWNRGPLGELADHPLDDPRVTVEVDDVHAVVRRSEGEFDAILLDVDNGPNDIIFERNRPLYLTDGLGHLLRALRPGGLLGIWSLGQRTEAVRLLGRAGFDAKEHRVQARHSGLGGTRYVYTGRRPEAGEQPAPAATRPEPRKRPGRRRRQR